MDKNQILQQVLNEATPVSEGHELEQFGDDILRSRITAAEQRRKESQTENEIKSVNSTLPELLVSNDIEGIADQQTPQTERVPEGLPSSLNHFAVPGLRERRMRKISGSPSPSKILSSIPVPIENKSNQIQNTEAGPIVSIGSSAPEESAEPGLYKAMPKIEPVEGHVKVRGGIAAIGPDGEIEEDSELVDAANLGEGEIILGPGDVANALATQKPAKANEGIAKKVFANLEPELPSVASMKPVQNNSESDKPIEEAKPLKPEVELMPEAKTPGIVFAGNTLGSEDAIQRKVEEHAADGTVEKDKPDTLAPIITDDIAEKTNPVVDGEEVKNIANDTVVNNQAALLNGEQLGQVQEAVIGKPVREPHPFASASVDEPAKETGDDLFALNDLLAHPEKPLVGQEPKSVVPIQESSTSVGTERQVQEMAVPLTDQVIEPVLEKTSDIPTSSIELKNVATPEISPVTEAEQATENASAVPLERQGFSEQDTTRPEFWAENGPKASQSVQAGQSALAQPAQSETAKDAKGFWGWLLGNNREKHAAEKIAYVKNPHVTAADVLKHTSGDGEEPVIAKVA